MTTPRTNTYRQSGLLRAKLKQDWRQVGKEKNKYKEKKIMEYGMNVKLYLRQDGFTDRIENLENQNDALDIQQNDENYIQFIERIEEKASKINENFNKKNEIDIYNEDKIIRYLVAGRGYGLDKLINDKECEIRLVIACQGYGLDRLIKDNDFLIRMIVAEKGYRLDELINDYSYEVRIIVAKQGYELDKLINDELWAVRNAVANQGYGLDKLIDDKYIRIKNTVIEKLKELNYKDIKDWIKCNPDKCALPENSKG